MTFQSTMRQRYSHINLSEYSSYTKSQQLPCFSKNNMHFFQKNYSSFYFLHLTDTLLFWIIQDPLSDLTVHHHHLKTHTQQ